ncbi:MarR family transcriptional regulator [candidate division WWE3 bacterium]|nr:MarR family transcriptional regulator [candidate division WWE3 bacterium]
MNRQQYIESIMNHFQSIRRAMATSGHDLHKGLGITMAQASILFLIKHKGETTTTALAEEMGISKSATTQLIDGLMVHQLIVRDSDPTDGRVSIIRLSPIGTEHFENVREKMLLHTSELFSVLTDEELAQLEQITQKINTAHKGTPK